MCDVCLAVLTHMKILTCELGSLASLHASLFFVMSLKQFVWGGFFGINFTITALVPEINFSLLAK